MFRSLVSRLCLAVAALALASIAAETLASEVLVADRLTNRILRYSAGGAFLNTLLVDETNLDEPNGMILGPGGDSLYVASRQNSSVVKYDYNGLSAANPQVIIDASEGINVPASLLINHNLAIPRLYVSNLGAAFDGSHVSVFDLDGESFGDPLTGGGATGRSGLAFAPDGSLLVSSFLDQATFSGGVLKFNIETQAFEEFIPASQMLGGAGNLLVDGNALYVVAGFSGVVMKFDATTGQPDPTFTPISGLEFPASLSLAPEGDGILVGILGFIDGTGRIAHYDADGALIGTWANSGAGNPDLGFLEATGMLVVPSPEPVVGDTDKDGDVDLDDLNNVRNNFGATGAADGSLAGDSYPHDGEVNLDDLNGVRNNFGTGTEPVVGAPGSVPEPSALGIALGCLTGMVVLARRQRG